MTFLKRVSTFALTLALAAGNAGVCAGWAATPEERMECCTDGATCPMHSEAGNKSAVRLLTQMQADTCCASAEHETSSPSQPTGIVAITSPILGNGSVLPQAPPLVAQTGTWRSAEPIPIASIPRHVLLSVFLV